MKNQIPYLLTHRLEALPVSLVAHYLLGDLKHPRRAAYTLADRLLRDGLAEARTMLVSEAIAPPFEPLLDLALGEEAEDLGTLAYILSRRWEGPRRQEVFLIATKEATKKHGGHAGKLRPVDSDHHLLLAHVYFSLPERERKKWRDARWVSEQGWSFGGWEPDAVLLGRTFGAHVLIEIGGKYTQEKLERRDRAARAWRRRLY